MINGTLMLQLITRSLKIKSEIMISIGYQGYKEITLLEDLNNSLIFIDFQDWKDKKVEESQNRPNPEASKSMKVVPINEKSDSNLNLEINGADNNDQIRLIEEEWSSIDKTK